MDTSMPTVRHLFDSRIVYVIPNYQRTYVWTKDDQWEPLWLDVVGIADPPASLGKQHNPESPKPHFLGATVLEEIPAPVEDARRLVVVDGQQRLTTIQLLLTAVADAFREHEELSSLESSARNLTINWVSGAYSTNEPDKIQPLAGDFQPFTQVMRASRHDVQHSNVQGTIGDCYRFYRGKASEWLEDGGNSRLSTRERANALLATICDKLQVVAIYLSHDENEAAIFEALNARAEPLSEWDKVKNYILFKAGEVPGVNQGDLYERYLLEFDDRKWLTETGSGAARRRMSDQFLDYWLESRLRRPINTRRIFREFRTELDNPSNLNDLESWCNDLRTDGQFFFKWQTSQEWDGNIEAIFHGRRKAINIGAILASFAGIVTNQNGT